MDYEIEGRYLGGLSTGQFFLEPPDMDLLSRQVDEFGFDKEKYLEAVAEVPVFAMEHVKRFMDFYHRLASIIAETGLARLRLMELNRELEKHRDHPGIPYSQTRTAGSCQGLDFR